MTNPTIPAAGEAMPSDCFTPASRCINQRELDSIQWMVDALSRQIATYDRARRERKPPRGKDGRFCRNEHLRAQEFNQRVREFNQRQLLDSMTKNLAWYRQQPMGSPWR
jgi:hypothetical protein